MYTEDQIKSCFDDETYKYLCHKNQGGINNEKGNTYENFFAVFKIALLSKQVIEDNAEIFLYSQVKAFVDDFIIDEDQQSKLDHYQIKDVQALSWGDKPKSIADDFKKQFILNQKILSKESNLNLVVSDQQLKETLEKNLPEEINSYTSVIHFSSAPTLIQTIQKNIEFFNAMKYLSAFEEPEPDKLEAMSTVLLGAWCASIKSGISIMDILKKAQNIQPSFIRSFSQDQNLAPELSKILDNIPNFVYNVTTRGFLSWRYCSGLQEGTLSYSIDTEDFQKFQNKIIKHLPNTFEDL